MAAHRWLGIALALVAVASCSRKEPEINGIGKWVLMETHLEDAPGFCNPSDITFCSGNGAVPIGDQVADVGLYFRGPEPKSPLIEITLSVRRCDPAPMVAALTKVLGEPSAHKNDHYYWRGKLAFVAGAIPAPGRRCEISFVSTQDQERVAELTAEADGDAETTAPASR